MRRLRLPLLLALIVSPIVTPACGSDEEDAEPLPGTSAPVGPLGERADLPVAERLSLTGLSAPVDVVRDKFGRPHIYASSVTDAVRAEGYLVAKDRHLQLDMLRRAAEGRLSELLGSVQPSLIDTDIAFRHVGLGRVAKAQYEALPPGELRDLLDAYSDGISQAFKGIARGEVKIPESVKSLVGRDFAEWTPVDSLAIGRLQTWLLSYDGDSDVERTDLLDALRTTFTKGADPELSRRAGLERDLMRFAPSDPATTTTGYPTTMAKKLPPKERPKIDFASVRPLRDALRRVRDIVAPEGFGSNNWAIAGSKSATGHALVASDPHLSLSAPAVFWPVAIEVKDADPAKALRVSGLSFPGIPGIILGHNEHVAWGATVAGYDVTDVYAETLTADGSAVKYQGKDVPITTIEEVIKIDGAAPYTYRVRVVPHHGPILPTIKADHTVADPDPTKGALSVKWTGHEATEEIAAVVGLLRAKNVDEARASLAKFGVGAQNWMLGDTDGNILWTSHARVPIRDAQSFAWSSSTFTGRLPCLVLPGDGSAEWKGFLPDDMVPWAKNPPKGYLSTANNDPIGTTLDNDPGNDALPDGTPMYLACSYDIGFREGRIQKRLESLTGPIAPSDLASVQADTRSPMGAALVPKLLAAIERAEAERKAPGAAPDLAEVTKDPLYVADKVATARELLTAWRDEADYDAASGMDPETADPLPAEGATRVAARAASATLLFNAWLVRVTERVLGDELAKAGSPPAGTEVRAKALLHLFSSDPKQLATYDAKTNDSALWDDLGTPAAESRDERVIRALLDAFVYVDLKGGMTSARWGKYHTVTFAALVPLFSDLSIPDTKDPLFPSGFHRHGDLFVVDASHYNLVSTIKATPNFTYDSGPTQRMVANLDPQGLKVDNALPGGNVWMADSKHFRDEAELWRKNQTHPLPWSLDEVVAAAESRTVIAPAAK